MVRGFLATWFGFGLFIHFAVDQRIGYGQIIIALILAAIFYLPVASIVWGVRRYKRIDTATRGNKDLLDDVLMTWPTGDHVTVRHVLRSTNIKGITGSGKSTGSGATLENAIMAHPKSSILHIAQKPEEKDEFIALCERHNKPYRIIEEGKGRCNFLDYFSKDGADTREIIDFLSVMGETLDGKRGGTNEQFWKKLEERITFATVELDKQGTGKLEAEDLLNFLATAPYKNIDLSDPKWKDKFHNQTVKKGWDAEKDHVQTKDFKLAWNFFTSEFVNMDEKPRSSGLAGVMNTLHTFNTGKVQWMCGSDTEFSPAILEEGVSLLVNFPFTQYGPTGKFIAGCWKYATQKQILRRKWNKRFFNILFMDEFQACATSFDPKFLSLLADHHQLCGGFKSFCS